MGRDKTNERREWATEHFTKMLRSTMETPAWRALPPVAQALYPWIKLEWHGPKANNNGKLRLSVRQAAEVLGVCRKTAAGAFHELQAKGFIECTEPAHLGTGGSAKSPAFEVTEIELPNSVHRGGRKLFLEWTEGRDFPVARAAVQNPTGRNGSRARAGARGAAVFSIAEHKGARCGS